MHQAVKVLADSGVPARNLLYVSIDTPTYTDLRLDQLVTLFMEGQGIGRNERFFAMFDEVQYRREWEVQLKSLVDSYPQARFVASGSAAAALRLKSRESGAGRFTEFLLPPMTFAEYLFFIGRETELLRPAAAQPAQVPRKRGAWSFDAVDLDALNAEFVNYLNFGGFPEAAFSKEVRSDPSRYIREDIIEKVLLRDLPSLYGVADIQELYRLFTVLAYNTGAELNLDKLSIGSGVAKNTLRRYLDYLEAAFLIWRVRRVDETGRRFIRETAFKIYLSNPSMRAALFGPVAPEDDAMGCLAETATFSQWMHSRSGAGRIAYARWGKGREVDIVHLSDQDRPDWTLEVKWSDRCFDHPEQLEALVEFARQHALTEAATATTRTRQGLTPVRGVLIDQIPTALYCYIVGKDILGGTV